MLRLRLRETFHRNRRTPPFLWALAAMLILPLGLAPAHAQTSPTESWLPLPTTGAYRVLEADEGPGDRHGSSLGFAVAAPQFLALQHGAPVVEVVLPVGEGRLASVVFHLQESEAKRFHESHIRTDAPWEYRTREALVYRYASGVNPLVPSPPTLTAVSGGGLAGYAMGCDLAQIGFTSGLSPDLWTVGTRTLDGGRTQAYSFFIQTWEPFWAVSGGTSPMEGLVFVGVSSAPNCLQEGEASPGSTSGGGGGGGVPNVNPPGTPTLVSPTNGATLYTPKPTLAWNTANAASTYTLQVDDQSSFSSPAVSTTVGGTTWTGTLTTGKTYYWHVRGNNDGGPGAWSGTWSFSIPAKKSYLFALMGEVKWCSENSASWGAQIDAIAAEVGAAFSTTLAEMSDTLLHCWTTTDLDLAYDCDQNGGCVDGDAVQTPYPYNAANRVCDNYINNVKTDWEHARTKFFFFEPDVAQVLHHHIGKPAENNPLPVNQQGQCTDVTAPDGRACGKSAPIAQGARKSVALARQAPASESTQAGWACKAYVSSHEFAHNFKSTHQGNVWLCGGYHCSTLMYTDFHDIKRNEFTDTNRASISGCVQDSNCVPNSWPW